MRDKLKVIDLTVVQGLFLALLTLLVYSNSFPGAFILDDHLVVRNNLLLGGIDLATIFRSDYWHDFANSGQYRPLTILSLAVNRAVTGNVAWGYHLVNVLLHLAVTLLLWAMLKRWNFSTTIALWSAMLFAVHPLHAEVVDVIVGRSELLVAFFLLLAFCAARQDGGMSSGITLAAFTCALLSKEHAIVFIALLPLFDFYAGGVARLQQRWRLYAGLLLVAGLWLLWWRFGVVSPLPPAIPSAIETPLIFAPWLTRLLSGLALQGFYLAKLIYPLGQQIFYSQNELPPLLDSLLSISGLLVLVATATLVSLLIIGCRRKLAVALFGVFYFVSFAPTSNILVPIGVTFAERLAYFPSLWFCCLIAVAVDSLSTVKTKYCVWAIIVLCTVFWGGKSLSRNLDYASEARLYRAEVLNNPEDSKGWINLAEALACEGRLSEADLAYQRATALPQDTPYALRSRAFFLAVSGRANEARTTAADALAATLRGRDVVTRAQNLEALALTYLQLDDAVVAMELLQRAATELEDPDRRLDLRILALAALGKYPEAVEAFQRLKAPPQDGRVLYTYGLSLFKLGQYDAALHQLRLSLKDMESADAWNLLGVILSQQGDRSAAVDAVQRAVVLEPDNQHYADNLRHLKRRSATEPTKTDD